MFSSVACGACSKQFVPNNSTSKCAYCHCLRYRCANCVKLYGATRNTHQCQCGFSNCWYKLSEAGYNPTAKDRFWAQNTSPEKDPLDAALEFISEHKQLKDDNAINKMHIKQLIEGEIGSIKSLRSENEELREEVERVTTENEKLIAIEELRKTENEALRNEMETMRKEMASIKGLFINFESPKKQPQDSALERKMDKLHKENVELIKGKFDEFEEYNQMIEDIQMDQDSIEQNNREMEERNTEVCSSLHGEITELQNQIDNFVAETKSDLNDKKSKLIVKMKNDIHKLQERQKALIDQSRTLQQQNIKRSKVLQNELTLTKHKFNDTVQMKDCFLSYYNTEGDSESSPTGTEVPEKKKKFGSDLSLSSAASSFERIPDQEL